MGVRRAALRFVVIAAGAATLACASGAGAPAAVPDSASDVAAERSPNAEARLARAVAMYRTHLSGEALSAFGRAQEVWEAYRDANCRFRASLATDRAAASGTYDVCMELAARIRIDEVRRMIEAQERS